MLLSMPIKTWTSRPGGIGLQSLALVPLLGLVGLLSGCFGDKAPEVSFQTIKGQIIQPADYKGQVMLVNFWATSCTTCVKEMPAIVDTYNKYKDKGFRTVAVAMSYDRPDYVISFAESRQLPFDVALDLQGDVAKAYKQVKVTPTTYLVNKNGDIIKTYVGEPDFKAMHALIEQNL
jgi:peroxiredoxin